MKYFFFPLLFLFCTSGLIAQEENDSTNMALKPWYLIVKVNGIKYVGKIIKDDGREVLIDTKEIGKIYLKKSEIKSMTLITNDHVTGKSDPTLLIHPRYFLTSNALPLKKGENFVGLHLLGFDFTIPLSNSFSAGIFSSWVGSPFGLTLKNNFKTPLPWLNFSLGIIAGSSSYINSFEGYGGTVYGGLTVGGNKLNASLSGGYMLYYSGYSKRYPVASLDTTGYNYYYGYPTSVSVNYKSPPKNSFILSFSGFAAVSQKISFIFESIINVARVTIPSSVQHGSVDYTYSSAISFYDFFDPLNIFHSGSNYNSVTIYPLETSRATRTNILIFPAIRFQISENKSFQLTLGSTHNYLNGVRKSYPFPMCSWFVSF